MGGGGGGRSRQMEGGQQKLRLVVHVVVVLQKCNVCMLLQCVCVCVINYSKVWGGFYTNDNSAKILRVWHFKLTLPRVPS